MSEMKQLLFNQIVLNNEIVKIGDYRSVAHFDLFQVVTVTFRPVTKKLHCHLWTPKGRPVLF